MFRAIRSSILTLSCVVMGASPSPSVWADTALVSETAVPKGAVPTAFSRLRVWGFDVYDARLYVGDQRGQTGFALDLNYLRSLKGSDITKRTIDEMQRLGVSEANRNTWGKKLDGIFPDVVSGSSLTAIHVPGRGTVFLHNGKPAGEIAGDDFAKAFFGVRDADWGVLTYDFARNYLAAIG